MPAQASQQLELRRQAMAGLRGAGPGVGQDLQGLVRRFELRLQELGGRDTIATRQVFLDRPPPGLFGLLRLFELGVEIAHFFEIASNCS